MNTQPNFNERIVAMKKLIVSALLTMSLLTSVILSQGCALFVAGAAAGAAVGTISWANNELQTTQEVRLDDAWEAANKSMESLKFAVMTEKSRKDAAYGELHGRNAEDQPILIRVFRKGDKLTQINIRVGTFDTSANRAEAQLIYDEMKKRM